MGPCADDYRLAGSQPASGWDPAEIVKLKRNDMTELRTLRGLQERLIIDTSETQPGYLLAGKNRTYMRLSSSAYHLLQQRSRGTSFAELAEQLSRQKGQPVSPDEVETACQHILNQIAAIENKSTGNPTGFWLRLRLIPEKWVARIANRLSIGFQPYVAAGLFLAIISAVVLSLRLDFFAASTPADFWSGYGLFVLSLFAHELGHASACARYGARPSDIGVTLYLIYPAFYSDVSAAWELKRWQRVVVDLGGTYFQFVIGAGYILAYILSGWTPWGDAVLMILAGSLFSLNPIFKFDGYWLVADALGVVNLSQQPTRIARYMWHRLRGQTVKSLPWPPVVIGTLAVYSLASFGIWGLFLLIMLPMLWQQVLVYPSTLLALVNSVLSQPPTLTLDQVGGFATETFLVVIAGLMVWQVVTLLGRSIKTARQKSRPLPSSNA
jgi:putative peptide zinc metalloprotease protein